MYNHIWEELQFSRLYCYQMWFEYVQAVSVNITIAISWKAYFTEVWLFSGGVILIIYCQYTAFYHSTPGGVSIIFVLKNGLLIQQIVFFLCKKKYKYKHFCFTPTNQM